MALNNDRLSKNQNINIRSAYVLSNPLYHQLVPYRAPPVFPKVPRRPLSACSTDSGSSYRSIYRNWPQQLDDDVDDLPGRCADLPPEFDDDGEDDYGIIRRPKYQALTHVNRERRTTEAEERHQEAVDRAVSRASSNRTYDNSAEHLEFVENRVRRFVNESKRQTDELLALTRVNTALENDERDDKKKRIRQRLFLKKNSPFSAAQSVVATRLEEKLYATSPIDLLVQKNRTRCQYSNLPVIRKLNELAIREEKNRRPVDPLSYCSKRDSDCGSSVCDRRSTSEMSKDFKRSIRGKSASAIGAALYAESLQNIKNAKNVQANNRDCLVRCRQQHNGSMNAHHEDEEEMMRMMMSMGHHESRASSEKRTIRTTHIEMMDDRAIDHMNQNVHNSIEACRYQLANFSHNASDMYAASSKQTAIEIEQLNARLVEAETKLKTEVMRIKKKLQMTITELEMSLDVANKTNIDLQKTIKKQSLQLTEIQAHYDEIQRQLQQTLDQYAVAQRRIASLTGEVEEIRGNYEHALRGKKAAEVACEEAGTKIVELNNINVSLATMKSKLEQELTTIASDYEEVTRELRLSDERYQKVQVELKHTVELLHEEQERIVKIETIKKSLEFEVKNLSVRLEEVEANAVVGAKRVISKLEARIRDLELELEEEKRRHAETIKILRKKERTVKEIMIQCEEDQKNVLLLQESLDKATQKIAIYKRQLSEQEGVSSQSVTRVRRFQRELEAAEDRADCAETNLNMIRAKHRSFVTTSTVPGGAVYVVESTRTITE